MGSNIPTAPAALLHMFLFPNLIRLLSAGARLLSCFLSLSDSTPLSLSLPLSLPLSASHFLSFYRIEMHENKNHCITTASPEKQESESADQICTFIYSYIICLHLNNFVLFPWSLLEAFFKTFFALRKIYTPCIHLLSFLLEIELDRFRFNELLKLSHYYLFIHLKPYYSVAIINYSVTSLKLTAKVCSYKK